MPTAYFVNGSSRESIVATPNGDSWPDSASRLKGGNMVSGGREHELCPDALPRQWNEIAERFDSIEVDGEYRRSSSMATRTPKAQAPP